MINYSKLPSVSNETCKKIIYYYYELYKNYEMKTPPQIADELGLASTTVHKFFKLYLHEQSELTEIYVMIMLSTNFGSTSIYLDKQQELFGEMIEQRRKINEQKTKREQVYKMVKKRSIEYMQRRGNHLK